MHTAGVVSRFAPDLLAGDTAPLAVHGLRLLAQRAAGGLWVPDRVCWSRVGYRQHFRPPAALREIRRASGRRSWELCVDLGQTASPANLERRIAAALDGPFPAPGIEIGSYVAAGGSPMWQFNAAFWRHLSGYMAAVGRQFRDSIGGSPDSDAARTREHARRFCAEARVAGSMRRAARPLAYLDIGVADAGYAETMIRHLAAGRPGAVDYLVADSSTGALRRARERLGDRRGSVRVRYLRLDLRQPLPALEPYRGRLLVAHLTNMLDNLPGDELALVGGRRYLLHTCLYLPEAAHRRLAATHRLDPEQLAADLRTSGGGVEALLAVYRNRFEARHGADGERRWHLFWQDLFGNPADRHAGLRLRERLVEIPKATGAASGSAAFPGSARLAATRTTLAELLAPRGADAWIYLSDRAAGACLQLLDLLHPRGVLEITDIMIRDRSGTAPYAAYLGPAKYDGSVVTWFNGGLFMRLARRAFPGCRATWRSLAGAGKAHMTCLEVRHGGR